MRSKQSLCRRVFGLAVLLCLGISPLGAKPAHAQQGPYTQFTNSLTNSTADPGALWIPPANGLPGTYIGGVTTGGGADFYLYGSPRLEDLYNTPMYDMSTYASQSGFVNPIVSGSAICGHGSPSFIIWKGVLYMNYGASPISGIPAGNQAKNLCGADSQAAGGAFIQSPIYVMYNTMPQDPFCKLPHPASSVPQQTPATPAGGSCWFAETYTLNNPFPGRAWSYVVRHAGTPQADLWAFYVNNQVNVLHMADPGQPYVAGTDPANAVNISYAAMDALKAMNPQYAGSSAPGIPYSQLTLNQQRNFRTWEFRDFLQNGVNEGPEPFITTDSHGNEHLWLTYSTNTYQEGDYAMGMLEFTGGENEALDDTSSPNLYTTDNNGNMFSLLWTKLPQPVFQAAPALPDIAPQDVPSFNPYATPPPDPQVERWECGVGTNSIVPSPDGTQLWDVYVGRFDCGDTLANQGGLNSLSYYYLTSPTTRSLRLQQISVAADGTPNFGTPANDGAFLTRPGGEDTTTPPGQMLIPTTSSVTYPGTTSEIFSTPGWTASGSSISGKKVGEYVLITYQGATIKLLGPTTTGGTVRFIADGNYGNIDTVNLSNAPVSGVLFDSTSQASPLTSLQTPGQHTLLMEIEQGSSGKGAVVELDSVVLSDTATPGSVNLQTSAALTKTSTGYTATVTVTNKGSGVAPNVTVTSATLGSAGGATLPASLGDLQPDASASVTLSFAASAGADNTATSEHIAGTYTGGTFGGTMRTTLP